MGLRRYFPAGNCRKHLVASGSPRNTGEYYIGHQIDFILAVGGGSVIDCCKVISAQAVLGKDIWKMEYETGVFPKGGIPMCAIVTTSGTGAEMNVGAVITYEEKNWKGPTFGNSAAFAILDPAYTMSVPPMQFSPGAFDTLSYTMETYLGTLDDGVVS